MRQRNERKKTFARAEPFTAAICALALHAWLGWELEKRLPVALPEPPAAAPALQVVWILPRAPMPPRAAKTPRRRRPVVAHASPTPRDAAPPQPAPSPAARPLTAVLAGQARQWAQQQAPITFAVAAPLDDVVPMIPGQPASRFRMRTPLTPAVVVSFIGRSLGNGPDPCVSNRDHLAAYANGRETRALELAVEFDRRYCRP